MTSKKILRGSNWEEVAEVKVDSQQRVALGRKVEIKGGYFRIYQNDVGQIILDPMTMIPAHEAWLYKNKAALRSVEAGIAQAASGKLKKRR
ncbi:hypothetical protein ACFL2T_06480 [Elusimicrobiota bacterium]